jgi:hypothetical protein
LRGCARLALSALLFALFPRFPLAAQNRTDVKIFIPRPLANTGINKQQDFFAEQFKMEISAANYTVTDGQDEADYLIQLTIDDNEYWGEPDEKQFILTLALIRAEGSAEIVRFSWPFTEMIEMYQWNLYLVYQAMANVPMTKEVDEPVKTIVEREIRTEAPAARDDRWRNKWLYVNFSAGADMVYLVRTGSVLTDQGLVAPIGFVGAEIQFLDMMALELDALKVRLLHDTNRYVITLNSSALLKWVFKPDDFAMIEPYAGAEYSFAVTGEKLPWLSVLAGVQAGVRGGERGSAIIDFGVSYSLLGSWHLASGEREYGVMRFVFSAGYKFGFWDRKK